VNWTEILAKAGIPESPGRAEAEAIVMQRVAERAARVRAERLEKIRELRYGGNHASPKTKKKR
jgi:hypothetical protein